MRKKLSIVILLCIFILSSYVSIEAQWAKTYGGAQHGAFTIQQTSDGGFIVIGDTQSFGAGGYDAWVLKLGSDGTVEWQKTYGGTSDDYGLCIQQTSDDGYIMAGGTHSFGAGLSDIWVLKLGSDGSIQWEKTYGRSGYDCSSSDRFSIIQTNDGGYIIGGGYYIFCVIKLSSIGDIEWQKTYGGSGNEEAYSIQQTSDGGYIVSGYTDSFGAGASDIWILKLSSTGSTEWQKTYGDTGYDDAYSIQQTTDGGYIVAGKTDPSGPTYADAWILKLTSTGSIEWQKKYGDSNTEEARSIQQTDDGGYIVAGGTMSYGAGYYDFWVLKLFSNGDIDWQKTYGGGDIDNCRYIQLASDGGYIVAGGTFSLGVGNQDFLVLRLPSNGSLTPLPLYSGFVGDSSAAATDTSVSPSDTTVTPQDGTFTTLDTSASIHDTNATVYTICEPPKYTLTISATTGGTTDPAPGSHQYDPGTQVSVTAIPNSGYQFSSWSGDVTGSTNPVTVTMDSDKSITANFTSTGGDGDDGDGADGGGGGCFIATAAYGSALHPHVQTLRDFRDKYLVNNKFGRVLLRLYYKHSPFFADLIAKNKILKIAAQINLMPFIMFSFAMVNLGPFITGAALVISLMLSIIIVRIS